METTVEKKVIVRVSPDVHRNLKGEAAKRGESVQGVMMRAINAILREWGVGHQATSSRPTK